jgi:hypothetical protein
MVAAESLLVIAVDVVQAPNDKQQIAPMLEKVDALPEQLGRPEPMFRRYRRPKNFRKSRAPAGSDSFPRPLPLIHKG